MPIMGRGSLWRLLLLVVLVLVDLDEISCARPSSVTHLGKTARFKKASQFHLKLMPKTGSTFTSKVLNKVLSGYSYSSDVASVPADAHKTEFIAVTMRNPCEMYVSLAHYGGAPGHVARPYYPSW